MGLGQNLKKVFGGGEEKSAPIMPSVAGLGPWSYATYLQPAQILAWTASEMYRTQPHLRTVISFIARNAAQCNLQTYTRVSDTDRRRLTDSPAALLLAKPNPQTTGYELIYQLVSQLSLYDSAYLWVTQDASSDSGFKAILIPPEWVIGATYTDLWTPDEWWVQPKLAFNTQQIKIPAEQVIQFHGWDPSDPRGGLSPVSSLKEILVEQVEANKYRTLLWKNGAKTSGFVERPMDAPEWDIRAYEKFMEDLRSNFSGKGPNVGAPMLMPDGMHYNEASFSATDSQYIESVQLAFETVCGVYHVNPSLVGSSATTSYSNVKEFRKMLYGDTLGPLFEQICQRIDNMLLPMIGEAKNVYVEFNIQAKLAGNFEEQSASLQTAVGGPWMSVDEARALNNLPTLGSGFDTVITPLNVVRGGGDQANPADSAPAPADRTGPGDSQPY